MAMDTKVLCPSRRGFLKGMAIGAGAYAVGSSLICPQSAFGQSIEANVGKVPMETRWNIAAGGLINTAVTYYKELYDNKGREQYFEYWKKNAPLLAARNKGITDSLGFKGNDAKSAIEIIPTLFIIIYGPKQKYETIEATTEKARLRCINCELWNNVQARKITDDLCSVLSQYFWDGYVKAMNPKMSSTLTKARPRGDSVCEWAFELQV